MANVLSSHRLSEPKTKAFGLLDLPPELWTFIVELAVTEDAPVEHQNTYWQLPIYFGEPPIARNCHTLRSEARKLFYAKNEFLTDGASAARATMSWSGCGSRNVSRRVTGAVRSTCWCTSIASLGCLRPFPGDMLPEKRVGVVEVRRCKKGRIDRVTIEDRDGHENEDGEDDEELEGGVNDEGIEQE